jgi:hypothetical protein
MDRGKTHAWSLLHSASDSPFVSLRATTQNTNPIDVMTVNVRKVPGAPNESLASMNGQTSETNKAHTHIEKVPTLMPAS